MNTFHPYQDDENEPEYYEDDMHPDDLIDDNDPNEATVNTRMLPPDDSLSEFELWDNRGGKNKYSPGNEGKPKSRGRYDQPQETGDFKEQRKQWEPRVSNVRNHRDGQNVDNYNSNPKDRQFSNRSPDYTPSRSPEMFPDVSQINEEELLESQASVGYQSSQLKNQSMVSESQSHSNHLLSFHNEFFSKLYKVSESAAQTAKIQSMEREIRVILHQISENKDPEINSYLQQQMKQKLQSFMQQLSDPVEEKRPTQNLQRAMDTSPEYLDDQNMHPNVSYLRQHEESKLGDSYLDASAISNNRKYQQRVPRQDPITPDSVNRKFKEPKPVIEPGERAMKFDQINNHSPIYPTNAFPEMDDEIDEQKNEELSLSMPERLSHSKWQIRKNAYTEIASMFEQFASGKQFFIAGTNDVPIEYNPYEKYQEWLIRMIRDTNLIAQYEGLNTLLVYITYSQDIKNATLSTLPDLLDKINHKKNNFRDITIRIIETMFEKDMGHHIVPELLKRFKTARNNEITEFSIQLLELIVTKNNYMEVLNLKHIFNGIANTLVNRDNKIRDAGLQLLKEMYIRVDDDCNSIIDKLKHLRPVLKKEIRTSLTDLEKIGGSEYYRIFQKVPAKENQEVEESQNLPSERPTEDIKVTDVSQDHPKDNNDDSKTCLVNLVSENFEKLPYVNQIIEKKNELLELYNKLKHVYVQDGELGDGDNYKVYNVLTLMLEDTNALVCMEAIRIVEMLAKLRDTGLKGKYARKYTEILFERFKETKTQVLAAIRKTLDAFIENDIIGVNLIIEIALSIDSNAGIKNKKVIVSNSKAKVKNPKAMQNALEYLCDYLSSCNEAIASRTDLEDTQTFFIVGVLTSHFEKPLLKLLTKESSNSVREVAYTMLKLIKRLVQYVKASYVGIEGVTEVGVSR